MEVGLWIYRKLNHLSKGGAMKRNDVLEKTKTIINGEREGQYGSPEDSFQIINLVSK